MTRKSLRIFISVVTIIAIVSAFSISAFAAGDVSSAIQSTWQAAQEQIKSVVNNVVFPVIDMILAVLFFVKLGTAYFDCAPVKVI